VEEHVPKDVKVTVTSSPRRGIDATLRLAEELARRGFAVVPHVSARLVRDESHLREVVERLRAMGAHDALVIAGDVDRPAGEYAGAADLLSRLAQLEHSLDEIGIAGYPESHPLIDDEAAIAAMFEKEPFATYIVSQLCFDPGVIAAWIARVRERGVRLPVYVGIPGVVSNTKLLRISRRIGVGESARFLGKHANRVVRLLLPGGYRPDRLLAGLAQTLPGPEHIAGFHVYTFNEVEKTEAWRRQLTARVRGQEAVRERAGE
jgi:methylenetetrahydrofolate reductase (NADPH)